MLHVDALRRTMVKIAGLDRGPKVDVHVRLYEKSLAVVDKVCRDNNCNRTEALEVLIDIASKALKGTKK